MGLLRWLRLWGERLAPVAASWSPRAGLLLLALAAASAGHSWLLSRALAHATATVTENIAVFAPGGGVIYQPRLRFQTATGEIEQVLIPEGSSEPEFTAGASVPVAWPTGNPHAAAIATRWRVYRAAIWLAIAGVVLFDLGWILRLAARRELEA
jgi:hypothetical protein